MRRSIGGAVREGAEEGLRSAALGQEVRYAGRYP